LFPEAFHKVLVKGLGECPAHWPVAVTLGNFLGYSTVGDELVLGPVGFKIFHTQNFPHGPNETLGIDRIGLRKSAVDIKDHDFHQS
jgi:hypothetical protein